MGLFLPDKFTALVTLTTLVLTRDRSSHLSVAPNNVSSDAGIKPAVFMKLGQGDGSSQGQLLRQLSLPFSCLFFWNKKSAVFVIFFCLKGEKKNGRRAFRCRLSGVIKTDAVGPLLSDTSHRIRIFMALYLNPFCWHKHAAQRWASPT